MRKTDRLEDLGRIREKLDQIYTLDYINSVSDITQEEFLQAYNNPDTLRFLYAELSQLADDLAYMSIIARGDEDD